MGIRVTQESDLLICDGSTVYRVNGVVNKKGKKWKKLKVKNKSFNILDIELDNVNNRLYFIDEEATLGYLCLRSNKVERLVTLIGYGAYSAFVNICEDKPEYLSVKIVNPVSKRDEFLVEKMVV